MSITVDRQRGVMRRIPTISLTIPLRYFYDISTIVVDVVVVVVIIIIFIINILIF